MHIRQENVLVVLAHQDDEYFAAPWILAETERGNTVVCVYLTDGATHIRSSVRDSESRRVLPLLGVPKENIAFIGSEHGIPDGSLVRHLREACTLTAGWLAQKRLTIHRIYAPDYEGGHIDHDAAHVVAYVIAERYGVVSDAWGFTLYNGYATPRPLFRTLRPLRRAGARRTTYSLGRGIGLATLCRMYRSQLKTWLGLFPEAFVRRTFLRSEQVNPFDKERLSARPHDGVLLYEWMFKADYSEFSREAQTLLADGELLVRQP